jgi:hypothetical protein
MTGPRIDPQQGQVLTGDQWAASQYAPASAKRS